MEKKVLVIFVQLKNLISLFLSHPQGEDPHVIGPRCAACCVQNRAGEHPKNVSSWDTHLDSEFSPYSIAPIYSGCNFIRVILISAGPLLNGTHGPKN